MTDVRASGRELAVVAVALLVPVPLFAAGGLHFALPAAIERGVASLIPGGGPDLAVVGAAPARSSPRPTVTPAVAEDDATSEAVRSSPTRTPGSRTQYDATGDDRARESESGSHAPAVPGGGAEAPAEPGGGDTPAGDDEIPGGDTGGVDGPAPPAPEAAESAPSESSDAVEVHAAVATVEITADAGGVAVTTDGEADAVPDLSLPAPTLPLP